MISDIRLQHFRSYGDDSFEFDPGVNIIVGPNASGKTNLLEALLVGCAGASYRVRDAELVQFDEPWSRLDLRTENGSRAVKLEWPEGQPNLKKTFIVDNHSYIRLPLHKTEPVVLFEPNHLQLLHGSPELRREFLDNLLEQTVAGFGVVRRQYKRALAQRNALLKVDPTTANEQLFAWNIRLSELGGQIAARRMDLIGTINDSLSRLYNELSHTEIQLDVSYISACEGGNYSSTMLQKLDAARELDYRRGFTAYGPHRDDFVVTIRGHIASEAASRGEVRTMLLGLKIIESQLVESARDKKPILLLDDVFSELDGARRKALTEFLSGYQTFITTTDADVVVQHFMDRAHIIPLA